MANGPKDAGPVCALVLAGGSGARFGGRPKQFETVGGVRMVDHAVALARRTCDLVTLVLPAGTAWDGEPVDALAVGGDHQSKSVRAGLAMLPPTTSIVVVIDPAHPLASEELVEAVIEAVRRGADGAVPGLPMHDVVQRVRDGRIVEVVPKHDLVQAQTPQAFRASVLHAVHADRPRAVENSGLLVARGYRVVAVPGDPANVHVTTPAELAVVDAIAIGRSAGGGQAYQSGSVAVVHGSRTSTGGNTSPWITTRPLSSSAVARGPESEK